MKIRQGFVSNSSSTSFMIYGIIFNPDFNDKESIIKSLKTSRKIFLEKIEEIRNNETKKYFTKIYEGNVKNIDELLYKLENDEYDEYDEDLIIDIFFNIFDSLGLDCYKAPYVEYAFVGRDFSKILENQTRKEFEEETKQIIKKAIPDIKDDEFGLHDECWFD